MRAQGFVLVPALLLLFLISLLVLKTYETVLMQYQLQQIAQCQQQLFFLAEHGLRLGETSLQSFSENGLSVKVERLLISNQADNKQFADFRISSVATQKKQSVCLQSIMEVSKRVAKRNSWLVIAGDENC